GRSAARARFRGVPGPSSWGCGPAGAPARGLGASARTRSEKARYVEPQGPGVPPRLPGSGRLALRQPHARPERELKVMHAETKIRPKLPIRRAGKKPSGVPFKPSLHFHRKNLYLLAVAAGSIVLGYLLLAAGVQHWAALMLVAGYLVLFPVAIVIK